MAKKNHPREVKDETDAPSRFVVRSDNEEYSGVHPSGVRFSDGIGTTDDAQAADECIQAGMKVVTQASDEEVDGRNENP